MTWLYALQFTAPLILIGWLLWQPARSRLGFVVQVFASVAALAVMALRGIWLLPPWWAPIVFAVGLAVAAWLGWRRIRPISAAVPATWGGWLVWVLLIALGTTSTYGAVTALRSRTIAAVGPVNLAFPLEPGRYLVVNGGSNISTNAHLQTLDAGVPALTLAVVGAIAMSRFGYLRTPMPADASAAAQADARVCLLDALGIPMAAVLGGSAGAPSALQMAIRHPDRVTALVLLVPLTYKPPMQADSASPLPPWVEAVMMRMIGSDVLFWSALHLARNQVIKVVLATPPELLAQASKPERAGVDKMLDDILPVSLRAEGLRSDTAAGKHLSPSPLESIRMPTLVISARDDRYGTYASAQFTASRIAGAKFIGFNEGGHTWVGHDDEVRAAIVDRLLPSARP